MKSTSFDIDKDIPTPKRGRKSKYPFDIMVVGDSFFADNRIAGPAAYAWAKRHQDVKFTARVEGDGTRVWRSA